MRSNEVFIIGAGGHAREVLGVLRAVIRSGSRLDFQGFLSKDPPDEQAMARISARWVGRHDDLLHELRGAGFVVGIGDPEARKQIAQSCEQAGLHPVTLVHPATSFGDDVEIQPGSVVFDFVSLSTNIRLGRHVHINRNSTIGHDARIGDFVTVNPMVAISGDVEVGSGAQLGTQSSILQGMQVGEGAVIGAAACVIENVAPGATVIGVPARPLV